METRRPRLLSVGSVLLTLPMHVPALPERGGAVIASMTETGVGGAFEVMSAAARQGVEVLNLCPLGTGPNSMVARQALRRAGIASVTPEMVGDTGMILVLLEDGGYYTSVLSPGIEADLEVEMLAEVEVRDNDWIYLSAGDLILPSYRRAMLKWLGSLPASARVVVAASSLVAQLQPEWLQQLLPHVSVFSSNEREAQIVARLVGQVTSSAAFRQMLKGPDAIVIDRLGGKGTYAYDRTHPQGLWAPPRTSALADTIGAGGMHIGTCIAGLMQGRDLAEAMARANIAGAAAIAVHGLPECPAPEQIDQILRQG